MYIFIHNIYIYIYIYIYIFICVYKYYVYMYSVYVKRYNLSNVSNITIQNKKNIFVKIDIFHHVK